MSALHSVLSQRIQAAAAAFGTYDPELRSSTKPEFGHYQTNLALRIGNELKQPPREIAARLVSELQLDDLCEPPEIAGPGFINLTLLPQTLAAAVNNPETFESKNQKVVVDYSQPNVAKQMHVGHLRSTVIGDALCNVLTFAGYDVIRQNHVGDWGTQYGMMIEQLLEEGIAAESLDLEGLQQLYERSRKHFDADGNFADKARLRVVALQSGDPETRAMWRHMVEVSLNEFDKVYELLGTGLQRTDVVGESAYNDDLPQVVEELDKQGLLTESDGALCAFLPGFQGRDGSPLPVIVRKSDGGFGYSATDLAAVRHRVNTLHADRIVYVVDHRQALHFDMIFTLARTAGWLDVPAEHVSFGTVLGPNGKPFKTREGGTVKLVDLLNSAVQRASDRESTARAVGIGAVKYADLSSDRGNDYVFDLDRMVAMTGNTGPYLQYAHARLTRLLSKAPQATEVTQLTEPAEQRLALLLTGFAATVEQVAETLQPHRLCTYLYAVASALSVFYEQCSVLSSAGETRASRIALCAATRKVLQDGLGLLGIEAPDAM
ncbi:arginine--tRNA ligase [Kribbella sp. GL6]|uniref:arginine--tRNA ligase n=1 Tax=Kribbella sp. GL6 TaxID=3419765 RepID=UPI003D047E2A